MRTFEHFPEVATCPICGTSEDKECVLIPIDGAQDGNISQAQPFHTECIKIENMRYQEKTGIVYLWCKEEAV